MKDHRLVNTFLPSGVEEDESPRVQRRSLYVPTFSGFNEIVRTYSIIHKL